MRRLTAYLDHRRSRRTPTVLQAQTTECGVASLAVILAHHGRHVSLDELRGATGVSRDGNTAGELIRAARHFGLAARVFRAEPEDLPSLGFPLIAHMKFIHFVVVEGMTDRQVFLNDPALGRYRMPRETFHQSFTGVALTFMPTPEFQPGGRPFPWLAALARRFGPWKGRIALVALAGLLSLVVPTVWVASLIQQVVDRGPAGAAGGRGAVLLALAGAATLKVGLGWLRDRGLARLQRDYGLANTGPLLQRVLHLPFEFFAYRLPSNLHGLIHSHDALAALVCGRLVGLLPGAVALPMLAVALSGYDRITAAVVVGIAGAWWLTRRWTADCVTGLRRRYESAQAATWGATAQNLEHVEMYKTGGMDDEFFAGLAGQHAAAANARRELDAVRGWLDLLPVAAEACALLAVVGLGGWAVIQGRLSLGAMAALLVLTGGLLSTLRGLLADGGELEQVRQVLSNLAEIEALPQQADASPAVPGSVPSAEKAGVAGSLALRCVTFGYARHKTPMISDVSLTVSPGVQLAIAGRSASGKSTLAGLLAGLHRPWSGQLELDGQPIDSIPRDVLARSIAWVDRLPFLFEGTVRENLCLWEAGLAEDALRAAVRDACLDDVLAGRAGGLDAHVAPHGVNFSGGQRLRLEIARALARDPSVLVLDGALDALEPELERRLRDNLRRRGCTVVLISQRAGTILACDEVVLVEGGKVAWSGSGSEAQTVLDVPSAPSWEGEASPEPVAPSQNGAPGRPHDPAPAAPLLAAFRLAAAGIGEPSVMPEDGDLPPGRLGLHELAHRARLRLRRVRLGRSDWWRHDHGPLLAFRTDGQQPVALRPARGGYVLIDPVDGRRQRLTAEAAAGLELDAYMLYGRPSGRVNRATQWLAASTAAASGDRAGVLLAGLVLAVLGVAGPLAVVGLFRHLPPPGGAATFGWIMAGLAAATVGTVLLHHVREAARQQFEARREHTLLTTLWDRLIRLPVPFLRRFSMHELASRAGGVRDLPGALSGSGSRLGAGTIVVGGAVLAYLHLPLAAVALGLLLPAVLVPVLLACRTLGLREPRRQQAVRNQEVLVGILWAIGRLRVTASEQRAAAHWERGYRAQQHLEDRLRRHDDLGASFQYAYPLIALAGLLAMAQAGVMGPGSLDPAGLVAFVMAFGSCVTAALGLGAAVAAWVRARPLLERLDPLVATPVEPSEGLRSPDGFSGGLELRGATFRYDDAVAPAVDGVSLRAEPGEFVAVVGPSGSGKSTLLRLLLGFERPQRGEVYYDGAPLAELDMPALRARLGAVLQEDRLASATVRYNLAGHSPYDLEQVWDAARVAAIDQDIRRLPMGMAALLDERKLSAGQKQRVLIAARVLRRPRVLLLDEATGAFDEHLQDEVLGNLKELGITCVCVTHRASTVAHADRVYVMENGRIVRSGRPAELFPHDAAPVRGAAASKVPPLGANGSPGAPDSAAEVSARLYRREALERFTGPFELDELVTFGSL